MNDEREVNSLSRTCTIGIPLSKRTRLLFYNVSINKQIFVVDICSEDISAMNFDNVLNKNTVLQRYSNKNRRKIP